MVADASEFGALKPPLDGGEAFTSERVCLLDLARFPVRHRHYRGQLVLLLA
jgi:hypothetical protein